MSRPTPDDELIERARRAAAGWRAEHDGSDGSAAAGETDAALDALAPDAIPGYRILGEVHRGGQGVVYEALQETTRRKVAIKVLLGGALSGPQERARFEREARLLGSLRHPGLVAVHDTGTTRGAPFLVMDYVPGQPLDVHVAGRRLSVRETLELFLAICEAVEAAHVRGIVHRDVKPSNVRVDAAGRPHVLDFGLAKPAPGVSSATGAMTVTGQFVGSLPWASPEQTMDDPDAIDLRTDVYSLGVVLYQMLTGRFPYEVVGNLIDVIASVRHARPQPPRALRPEVGDEVETIVLKCLAKDPARRYQSAGELARDVRAWLEGAPIAAKRESSLYVLRKLVARHRVVVGAAGLLALSVAAGRVATSLRRGGVARERDRAAAARDQVAAERAGLRRSLYVNRVLLAGYALAEGNGARTAELLEECPRELRGWEWGHLAWRSDRSRLELACGADVLAVAFGADGRSVATGDEAGRLRLWHASSGYELASVAAHGEGVLALVAAPDGAWLYSAGADGVVTRWDRARLEAGAGAEAGTLLWRGAARAQALALRPGGRALAVGDAAGEVRVLATDGGAEPRLLAREEGGVRALAWTPDGARLLAGTDGGAVVVRDAATGAALATLAGHGSGVTSLAVALDGARFASGALDGTARVWDAASGAQLLALEAHGSWVYGVAFDPYGERLVTCGEDHVLAVWDARSGAREGTLRGHRGRVFAVAFDPDGARILSGGEDGTARVWDAAAPEDARRYRGHRGQIWAVAFRPGAGEGAGGARLASAGEDGTARVWSASDERVAPRVLAGHEGAIVGLAWAPDGRSLATGGMDGTIRLWDPEGGEELRRLEGHRGWVYDLDFSADGRLLLSAGADGKLGLWDPASGVALATFGPGERPLPAAALDPSARWIASADLRGEVVVWSVAERAPLSRSRAPEAHEAAAFDLCWSPDGRRLATASVDGSVRLWSVSDAGALAPLGVLRGHRGGVRSVAWSPDGARLATGGWDATVRLFDPATGAMTAVLEGHPGRVDDLAFDPSGRRLASAGLEGELRVWETAPERPDPPSLSR